jgi:transcriptional regulator with GAF, ATPase, and Fis domain
MDDRRCALVAPNADGRASSFAEELRSRGVEVNNELTPRSPIVILDSGVQPAIIARLRSQGHRRVLVVDMDGETLGWDLLAAGAADVLDHDEHAVTTVLARLDRWRQIDSIISSDLVHRNLVGTSQAWLRVLEELIEAARFSTAPLVIMGESGTGKEMAARLVHTLDPRPDKGQLVVVDCTTIVPTLAGSELFGHAKGAFTGAMSPRRGAFALADAGTLFLDEIGELPPTLQSELLRVIQEGTYKPVGSDKWERTRFRLVAATNRDLAVMEGDGTFRADLYHRISAIAVRLPSLRERVDDIPVLAQHFLRDHLPDSLTRMTPALEAYLVERSYPGNVRDLKHLVARMAYRHVGPGRLTLGDVPHEERLHRNSSWQTDRVLAGSVQKAVEAGAGLRELKEVVAALAVDAALVAAGGNVAMAATRLGVTARAVQIRQARGDGARARTRSDQGPSETPTSR